MVFVRFRAYFHTGYIIVVGKDLDQVLASTDGGSHFHVRLREGWYEVLSEKDMHILKETTPFARAIREFEYRCKQDQKLSPFECFLVHT